MSVLALAACAGAGERIPVDDSPAAISPELRAACELASRRCSHCHSLDRVLAARFDRPGRWRGQVDRMRRMPQSRIPPRETPAIVRCLVFWSFGDAGLRALEPDGEAHDP
jgi:hypothetical protein